MSIIVPLDADDFSREPWLYPGTPPATSGVLVDGFFSRSTLGARLESALSAAGVPGLSRRTLVVSTGSNASPAVMRRKFTAGRASTTIPFIRGVVRGFRVAHSAHVSAAGYIAHTPVHTDAHTTPVVAALLDDDQLACLDATEPNYRRTLVDAALLPLELDGGDRPAQYHLYVSKWGSIARPGERPLDRRPQRALFRVLRQQCPGFHEVLGPGPPERHMRHLAGDEGLRRSIATIFTEAGWAADPGAWGVDVMEGSEPRETRS